MFLGPHFSDSLQAHLFIYFWDSKKIGRKMVFRHLHRTFGIWSRDSVAFMDVSCFERNVYPWRDIKNFE